MNYSPVPGTKPTPVHNTRVSQDEICHLIDKLQEKLGYNGYCVWLANYTPVEWLTVTPYSEIRDTLAAKLSEIQFLQETI